MARNSSAGSENRIHADDVAGRYGFRGGLVPGVTCTGTPAMPCCRPSDRVGGARRAHVRFLAPCYDGEELVVPSSGTRP